MGTLRISKRCWLDQVENKRDTKLKFPSEISNSTFTLVLLSFGRWAPRRSIHPSIYSFNIFSVAYIQQDLFLFWNELCLQKSECLVVATNNYHPPPQREQLLWPPSPHVRCWVANYMEVYIWKSFPGSLVVKNLPANTGDAIPGSGRSPGEGNGNRLQYSYLRYPMDRVALWAPSLGSPRVGQDLATKQLLLLLLSHFSRVQLCDPRDGSPWGTPTPQSLGFSRQEHWSGLPFPSPMHESEKWKWSRLVVSDSSRPHGLQPTSLLRPWDFPGKSTGGGCHCLLQNSSSHQIIVGILYSISQVRGDCHLGAGCRD